MEPTGVNSAIASGAAFGGGESSAVVGGDNVGNMTAPNIESKLILDNSGVLAMSPTEGLVPEGKGIFGSQSVDDVFKQIFAEGGGFLRIIGSIQTGSFFQTMGESDQTILMNNLNAMSSLQWANPKTGNMFYGTRSEEISPLIVIFAPFSTYSILHKAIPISSIAKHNFPTFFSSTRMSLPIKEESIAPLTI